MNDQTMRLAIEAGFLNGDLELFPETIERFAQLVRQDEREACIDVVIQNVSPAMARECEDAIRARGEK